MNLISTQNNISRRFMLQCLAGAGGSFLLGFNLPTIANGANYVEQPWDVGKDEINAWIEIAPDNMVTIRVPHTEQGQGGLTSVVQMIVEELDCSLDDVTAIFADMNRQVNEDNPYINTGTAGSALVRARHPHLCLAGASARERLKEAAANAWGVSRSEVIAKQGKLLSGSNSGTYGEFAQAASSITLSEEPKIKAYGDWWLMGTDLPRIDVPQKVDGSAKYCIDTEIDGMVYVAVKHCPVPWGRLLSFDKTPAEAIEGVLGILEFKAREGKTGAGDMQNAVAVVADSWHTAKTAVDLIPVEWDYLGLDKYDDTLMASEAARLWEVDGTVYSRAKFDPGEDARKLISQADPSKVVTNNYMRPFETHARMEPINATVWVQNDRVDVWSPTQNQATPIETVADELGLETKNIYSHTTFLGGAFGGNGGGNTAVTREAAVVSKLFGRPAKVIWSREEDINHDKQRPPHYIKLSCSLGDDGLPHAYHSNAVWYPFEGVERIGPAWADATISDMPYNIPNRYHEKHDYKGHIPTATHRGPGCNQNAFISEQFADELAIAGGWDPLEWRIALTKDSEPWQRVLKKMREVCGFTTNLPKGEGMGIAICKDHNAYAGACAKVSVSRRGQLTIEKVTIVTNAGYVINPRAAAEQCHGAVHWEMSHALTGGLILKNGKFANTNFDSYNLLRMQDSIPVEVHYASSEDQWWGGMGEPAGPPTPPAVANAIYFATGRRITSTPILKHDLTPI